MNREIDLHGETQNEAYETVLNAVEIAFKKEQKVVRIITGKSGIIKEKLPLWLDTAKFSPFVRDAEFDTKNNGVLIIYIKKQGTK